MDYNGCEVIAVYNAAVLLGTDRTLSQIAYDFQQNDAMWFFGIFGSKPKKSETY